MYLTFCTRGKFVHPPLCMICIKRTPPFIVQSGVELRSRRWLSWTISKYPVAQMLSLKSVAQTETDPESRWPMSQHCSIGLAVRAGSRCLSVSQPRQLTALQSRGISATKTTNPLSCPFRGKANDYWSGWTIAPSFRSFSPGHVLPWGLNVSISCLRETNKVRVSLSLCISLLMRVWR